MTRDLPTSRANYEGAFAAFRKAVGDARVLTQPVEVAPYARNTFNVERSIRGAVRVETLEEVQSVARIANQFAVPIYPISAGKNWGYGASVPVQDGGVILDLGGMNRILEYSAEMGFVTIEPGVTFQQLAEFLEEAGSRYMLNVTGAPPVTSVVGNTLERGLGAGPYGDRWQFVCGIEVVLSSGECLHRVRPLSERRSGKLFRAGVGPMLDGLFPAIQPRDRHTNDDLALPQAALLRAGTARGAAA